MYLTTIIKTYYMKQTFFILTITLLFGGCNFGNRTYIPPPTLTEFNNSAKLLCDCMRKKNEKTPRNDDQKWLDFDFKICVLEASKNAVPTIKEIDTCWQMKKSVDVYCPDLLPLLERYESK